MADFLSLRNSFEQFLFTCLWQKGDEERWKPGKQARCCGNTPVHWSCARIAQVCMTPSAWDKGSLYFSRIEPIFRRPLWCLCFLWGFWSPYRVVTHHQVAVNPQAGPHTVSLCWEKMRCNPPSMKSVFLLFSSAALPLVVLSFSIHPTVPTHSPLAGCSYWSLNE